MDIYNEDFKISLEPPGIYLMITSMMKQQQQFEDNYIDFIELLKYAQNLYGDKFVITFHQRLYEENI